VSIPTITIDALPDPLPDGVSYVDVREPDEWAAGHIGGATHIPLMELPARLGDLPAGDLVLVCKVGSRSAQAAMYLRQQGYGVVNLAGGMLDWEAAGRPMVSDAGQEPSVI
jgi:rhodanese-related sulfurtransferase